MPTCFWVDSPQTIRRLSSEVYPAYNLRTLVSLRSPVDPRYHYRRSRTLRMERPAHDWCLPTRYDALLSYCECLGRNHIRGREGGQAISFEEGGVVNVKVEFAHSKAIDSRSSRTVIYPSRPCSIRRRCTMQTGLIQNAHDDLVTDAAYDFYGLHLATCSLDQRSSATRVL